MSIAIIISANPIHISQSSSPFLNPRLKYSRNPETNNYTAKFSLPGDQTTRRLLPKRRSFGSSRTGAVANSAAIILGVTPPAKSGDVSVLLITSAVFLSMYWIANFVVPNIVSKSLQFDDEEKEGKS